MNFILESVLVANLFGSPKVDVNSGPFRNFPFLLRKESILLLVGFLRYLTGATILAVLLAI